MNRETHKVAEDCCPTPEITRAPTRTWQGSFDGPTEGASLAGGTTLKRKVGVDYDKTGEAERELPPLEDAYPAAVRYSFGG